MLVSSSMHAQSVVASGWACYDSEDDDMTQDSQSEDEEDHDGVRRAIFFNCVLTMYTISILTDMFEHNDWHVCNSRVMTSRHHKVHH
jgi:hypothetical protein